MSLYHYVPLMKTAQHCDCQECKAKLEQLKENEQERLEKKSPTNSDDLSEKLAAFFRGDLT